MVLTFEEIPTNTKSITGYWQYTNLLMDTVLGKLLLLCMCTLQQQQQQQQRATVLREEAHYVAYMSASGIWVTWRDRVKADVKTARPRRYDDYSLTPSCNNEAC